jgi:hypothetical protein
MISNCHTAQQPSPFKRRFDRRRKTTVLRVMQREVLNKADLQADGRDAIVLQLSARDHSPLTCRERLATRSCNAVKAGFKRSAR